MSDHLHDHDDPRMCMDCAPAHVTAADVRSALEALRGPIDDRPSTKLTDTDLIPLLGQLFSHLTRVIKHRVDTTDSNECLAFTPGSDQDWAVHLAHSLVPAVITATALLQRITSEEPVNPYAANTVGITHMATGVCAEIARIHIGRKHHPDDEVYRMLASLHEGLGVMIEHRLLTPRSSADEH